MQLIVNIVVLASLYCLIGYGYVLIYQVSRVLNLAHGELMSLGGYFLLTIVIMGMTVSPLTSFLLAFILLLALGLVIYFVLMRLMTGESVFTAVLVTISLGILLRGLITLTWTSQSWFPLQYMGIRASSFQFIGGAQIPTFGLVKVASALGVFLILTFGIKYTRWGIKMRAVGENPLLASQRGIAIHKYYALAWGLATSIGGLAGMIQACDSGLDPGMFIIGLKAFPVVLVAGLDSLSGVIPAALLVATAEILAINYISPQASDVAPFAVLVAMLLIRPWGLFGTKEELERV